MKSRVFSKVMASMFVIILLMSASVIPVNASDSNTQEGKTPSGIPIEEMEREIDDYVSAYIGKTAPGAAVAVVKDGKVIFQKGYGYADLENQIPVDPQQTVFEWASTSKLFTWTSVMQLVENGKLDLDTNISEYLPQDFAGKLEYQQPITMRDIMNHASGFGDYAFNIIVFSEDQLVSLEEAILRDKPEQYYEVGTASAYSNYATSLAGYLVQTLSDQNIEDYEKENIFSVLSMENTSAHPTFEDNISILGNKAQGYLPDQEGGFQPGNWSYISHLPAGSINGTVVDFAKFAIALTPGKGEESLLFKNPDTLDTMLSPSYDPTGEMVGTSHGFFEYVGEYQTFGHGGNTAAFSSQFAVVPEERFGIVILTNAYLEMDILFGLQDLLLGCDRNEIRVPDKVLPSSNKVVGKYVPMERQVGNFLDFAKYLGLYEVRATGENEITMNIGEYQGKYLQTEPYQYELIDDNIPLFRNIYPVLSFSLENDKVDQIVVGNGMDLSPLPKGRTVPFLIGSILTLLLSILFFFTVLVVLMIAAIKRRNIEIEPARRRFLKYQLILVLAGTAFIVNNLIPVVKIMTSNFRTYSEMEPFIMFNYPLLAVAIITVTLSSVWIRKSNSVTKKDKAMHFASVIFSMSLLGILWHWNFFAIVG
ncbi:MAG: beta-lactamase family protein [Gudongella sp.]|nr:beta-lactamase family protein [Gudongella sp.]